MRRLSCLTAGIVLLAATAGSQASRVDTAASGTKIRGLEFHMFDLRPTREQRGPTFTVKAKSGEQDPDTGIWTLDSAQAIAYNKRGDPMNIGAEKCIFDQERQVARLAGGVHVETGDMELDVDEIEWNNERGEAVTKGPAVLRRGETELQTSRVIINPTEETILCYDTEGRIVFPQEPSEE